MNNCSLSLSRAIDDYQRLALLATHTLFDTVLILRPLPTYVQEVGKQPEHPAHQWAIQYMIEGASSFVQNRLTLCAVINSHDPEVRLASAKELLDYRANMLNSERQGISLH